MSARILVLVGSTVAATVAVATAAPVPPEPESPPRSGLASTSMAAPAYRWMWGDAGNETFGHWVAELNPLRWSLWADNVDTIKNLEQYNKHDDKHRSVQIEVGPPPLKTLHYSNIGQAVEDLNSYTSTGNSGPAGGPSDEVEPSYRQEVVPKKSYPPGVFIELGGKAESKFEVNSSGRNIRWAELAEPSLISVGLMLLGVFVSALRRKILDRRARGSVEDATSSEVLPWVEQGNRSSDIEQQFELE